MASFFSACDVARAALEIERRGQEFFECAAASADRLGDGAAKELFAALAQEEAGHGREFAELIDRLDKTTTGCELPQWSTQEEYVGYMNALLESHGLFTGECSLAPADRAEALKSALRFEKDTLLFFQEMQDMVPPAERGLVERLIGEEKRHMAQLRGLLGR